MAQGVIDYSGKGNYSVGDLLEIVQKLRKECPWDREQTHLSIRSNMLEEASEAVEAIDLNDDALLCEELGDVLLQVVFHATLATERGAFSFADITNAVCNKLIVRHPHVFAGLEVNGIEEVLANWEAIKRQTKAEVANREE